MKSLLWNRQLLKYVGIWPFEISNGLFVFFFNLFFLQCLFTFAELVHGENDFEVNIAIFTENILLLITLTKITICWINRQSLRRLLVEIQNNFIVDKYNTYEKKFILMKYTNFAKYYFLITVPSMTIAAIFYYIQILISKWVIILLCLCKK